MLQHPGLPTEPLFDVPRSVALHFWSLSDVCYHFSPRENRLVSTSRLHRLCSLLEVEVTSRVEEAPHLTEERLVVEVLDRLALLGTHMVLVVQYFGEMDAGCMCLLDRCHFPALHVHLSRYGLGEH